MKIIKPLVVECEECNNTIEIDTDMECVASDERNMGIEIEYEGVVEACCPKCGNDIYVKFSAWEYPEGALNYYDTIVDGVIIIKEPTFSCYD